MGSLIISTQITLDGVMDVGSWFNRAGEQAWDTAAGRASFDQLRAADTLLLGRPVYEGLSTVWPTMADDVGFADRVNSMPKLVASRAPLGTLTWNARPLDGELVDTVTALKRRNVHLLSFGCGVLAHDLLTHGLVDELRFWVSPMLWGAGTRPFPDLTPTPLRLVSTTTFDTGVAMLTYRSPEAGPTTG